MSIQKLYPRIIFSLTAIFTGVLMLSFYPKSKESNSNGFIKTELLKTHKVFMEMDAISQMYQNGQVEINDLKKAIETSRLQFKRIEFYLTFYYPEYTKAHLNGAPLLRLEFENAKSVLEPEGLQLLDELIFSEDAFEQRYIICGLAKRLQSNFFMLYNRINNNIFSDENSIDLMRLQLVRVYTLGLTGFDTPGSLNAIQEAKASLIGLQSYFISGIPKESQTDQYNKCMALFDEALAYLNTNTNFEIFDRLEFLRLYLDPLYKTLKVFQSNKGDDALIYASSWNRDSESLFAADFLDPYTFTELNEEEDSQQLKALGEKLFYDASISGGNNMSCATCHQPEKGFTDGLPKSMSSINGQTVLRNAPTLLNAVYADRFFYDLRAYSLEQQSEHVIFNPQEFNTAYVDILNKLQKNEGYQEDFRNLFEEGGITRKNLSKALVSYVLSLQSFNSDFDKYVRGETSQLTESAKKGFNLFMGKANCATCHFAPTFSGLVPPFYNENESEILGVLNDENGSVSDVDNDRGRIKNGIYKEDVWIYEKSFKTTTVRNVALTAPYFHNGAYTTLESVVEFYDQGGGAGMGADIVNQTLPSDPLNLTQEEKRHLIAFMESLSHNPALDIKTYKQ